MRSALLRELCDLFRSVKARSRRWAVKLPNFSIRSEGTPSIITTIASFLLVTRFLNVSIIWMKGPVGPPVADRVIPRTSEPQPPSTEGLFQLKAPAPPPVEEGPQPPAAPDPFLLEAFDKSPETFPAVYNKWQEQQQQQPDNKREGRAALAGKRRTVTYDQFVTAAIVSGLDLQRSVYTMFAPSDPYLIDILNISLPTTALQDAECVRQIVR